MSNLLLVHIPSISQLKGENYVNFEGPRLHCHLSIGPDFPLWLRPLHTRRAHYRYYPLRPGHQNPPPSFATDLMPVIGIYHYAYAWR